MATLSGNKIKNTYQSLVKFSDNGNITTSAKQLTDGFGNNSPMFVSTTQVGIGVTPESGLNLHVFGDAKIGSNLTVIGNLVVEGSTTTVGTDTLTVKDPLIVLANNNTSTDAVDIGFYGKYTPSGTTLYSGIFREALTGKYRLFKGLEVEPTTTVNTSGTGYAVATLIASLEGNVIGNITGNVIGGTISGTTGTFSDNVSIATDKKLYFNSTSNLSLYHNNSTNGSVIENSQGDLTIQGIGLSDDVNIKSIDDVKIFVNGTDQAIDANASGSVELYYNNIKRLETTSTGANTIGTLDVDDVISVEGSAFGRIEIGGASGGYIDLKAPNSDDYDFRIITSSGGNELTTATGDLIFNTAETLALTLDTSQNATFAGDINLPLNKKIQLGNNQELEIYRDANDSRIVDEDSIIIKSQHIAFQAGTSTETIAHFYGDSSVELYYDGVKKFSTTSTGIDVTGDVDFTGNINIGDNQKILFGDSGDVEMFFNGSTFVIDDTVEVFGFDIDTNLIRFRGTDLYTEISNGQHTFWTNGTERFKINATEVKVSHQLNVTGDLTVGTDSLFVDVSTDSVGIGLTNPSAYSADTLVINTPDEKGITLVSSSTEKAYLAFQDGTGALENFMSFDHAVNKMNFNVFDTGGDINFTIGEGVTKFNIDNTNVRVYDDLTVDGNSTFAGTINSGAITTTSITAPNGFLGGSNGGIRIHSSGTKFFNITAANAARDNIMDIGAADARFKDLYLGGSITSGGGATFAGNVGIGTASPTDYYSGADNLVVKQASGAGGISIVTDTSSEGSLYFADGTTGGEKYRGGMAYNHPSDKLYLITAGATKATIDSSGNVGIGITPASTVLLDLKEPTAGSDLIIGLGAGTGARAQIRSISQAVGSTAELSFYTVTGNTAGERMRIDSSGRTSITGVFGAPSSSGSGNEGILRLSQSAGVGSMYMGFGDPYAWIQSRSSSDFSLNYDLALNPLGGNVGIGTDSPFSSAKLQVRTNTDRNVAIQTGTTHTTGIKINAFNDAANTNIPLELNGSLLSLKTGETEKMRITSGGFLKVSNSGSYDSATSSVHELVSSSNGGQIAKFTHSGTVPYGMQINYSAVAPNIVDNYFFIGSDSSANRIIIWGNGNIQNQNNSYGALSDIKLKENIVDATPKLDDLMKVKIRNYNLIGDNNKQIGVVAQELEEVFPAMIDESIDYEDKEITDEEGNISTEKVDLGTTTKSVKYSVFVPMLIKSIQEQQVMLKELKAEVDKLKQECKCKN